MILCLAHIGLPTIIQCTKLSAVRNSRSALGCKQECFNRQKASKDLEYELREYIRMLHNLLFNDNHTLSR